MPPSDAHGRRGRALVGLLLLVGLALAASCAPRVVREARGLPEPVSLREAWHALPGDAGLATVVRLDENALAWAARWQVLAEAEKTIEASYFIVEADVFGFAFLAHLYKKALDGVKVRLLLDGRGCLPVLAPGPRDFLQEMIATGNVEIGVHNPAILGVAAGLLTFDTAAAIASSHDKIIVVDSRKAIVGGRNIAANYFVNPAVDPTATIDADVLLEGRGAARRLRAKVVDELSHALMLAPGENAISRREELLLYYGAMDAWLRMDPADPRSGVEAALALEGLAISSLDTLPRRDARERARLAIHDLVRDQELRGVLPLDVDSRVEAGVRILGVSSRSRGVDLSLNESLLQALAGAERELLIQTPYFVLTKPALAAFAELARRGIRITVITNSPTSADNAASQALFVDEWPEVMARVPTMRLFVLEGPRLLHAKRMVLDNTLAMVGTYNLDPLSARINAEVLAAIWSPVVARGVEQSIQTLLSSANAVEYTIERDEAGEAKRYPEGHPRSGKVVVAHGPEHHVPAPTLDRLRALKGLLTSTTSFWDFEVAVW